MKLRLYKYLRTFNNILLIPLFTLMIVEAALDFRALGINEVSWHDFACGSFFAEWLLGLYIAEKRWEYIKHPHNIFDLISSIPFGHIFQSARIVRVFRLIRLFRVVLRTRRFDGKGAEALQAIAVIMATIFAGAFAILMVEPQTFKSFESAVWWSVVTVSTVGYGDISPVTMEGRIVAMSLIIFGIGVFGYVAGFTASLIGPEENDTDERLNAVERKLAEANQKLDQLLDASNHS